MGTAFGLEGPSLIGGRLYKKSEKLEMRASKELKKKQ